MGLYEAASLLAGHETTPGWRRFCGLMNGSVEGRQIIELIKKEQNLSEPPDPVTPKLMAQLLEDLSAAKWPKRFDEHALKATYESVLNPYGLKARPVAPKPSTCYRYVNGFGLFSHGIEDALNNLKQGDPLETQLRALRMQIKAAQTTEKSDQAKAWDGVLQVMRDALVWPELQRLNVSLCKPSYSSMFVGLEDNSHMLAEQAHAALGLSGKACLHCFIMITISDNHSAKFCVPTIADARWNHLFQGVDVTQNVGYTAPQPFDPPCARQREAARSVATLRHVQNPYHIKRLA